METTLRAMREAVKNPVAFHEADIRFHESVAEGAGNQMLSFLIEAMEEPLRSSRMQSMQGHLGRGGTVEDVVEQHARIFDRIKARDAAGAAAAMREHLTQIGRDLRVALALAVEPRNLRTRRQHPGEQGPHEHEARERSRQARRDA